MAALENKIDFVALISVTNANCNGDPTDGNRPRTDLNGRGEISTVCIKRKIRNRMQDMGHAIFLQPDDNCKDGHKSQRERADNELKGIKDRKTYAETACKKWMDVRSFGQVFAFTTNGKRGDGVSIGVRGPVTVHQGVSISPVDIAEMKITKSLNGEPGETRGRDTMGTINFVRFGLYEIKGAINVQLAKKTKFSQEDAAVIKECLRTLFVNDASSARPECSMEVVKLYWWEHNCKDGQYSSAKVHRSVHVTPKNAEGLPQCVDDYEITLDELPGLTPEIIDGL